MIVKMKKITILLLENQRESALIKLRQLGVLHLKQINPPVAENLQQLELKMENLNRALRVLDAGSEKQPASTTLSEDAMVEQVNALLLQQDGLQREYAALAEIKAWFDRWGRISWQTIRQLKEKGVFVRHYIADKNSVKAISADQIIQVVKEENNAVYLVLFAQSAEEKLELKEDAMPEVELSELENRMQQLKQNIQQVAGQIDGFVGFRSQLAVYRSALEKRLELCRHQYSMGIAGPIAYLQGYAPADNSGDIAQLADREGWGYIIEEPDEPNEVPTLLRNPKWLRIIDPLFKFMGTLPGYHEQDVSLVFLAFFSVFYAIIIGDGGYGLIFLLLTIWASRKFKSGSQEFFNLMFLVSFTTIIWGAITGTWFGMEKIAQLPFLKIFIIEDIYSFNPNSNSAVMQLSFILGVLHLSIGHLLSAFKKMNSVTALADVGWVLVLWAVFWVANNVVLNKELSSLTQPLMISGSILILLFANFQKNIIKGILITLGNLPLSVIGSFSDIVSYVRLFAVGLASVIIATTFNNMAIGSGIHSVVSGIIAALILFIGHAINLVLSSMSVLVHGVRLNMLEFSGHAGIQWTGQPYRPFKE